MNVSYREHTYTLRITPVVPELSNVITTTHVVADLVIFSIFVHPAEGRKSICSSTMACTPS